MTVYRLAAGTVTRTALLADAANIVTSFPGGGAGVRTWMVAGGLVTPYANRERTLAGTDREQGGLTFTWTLPYLNMTMWQHLYVTLLGRQSGAPVTVQTYHQYHDPTVANRWIVVNCRLYLPELNRDGLTPRGGRDFSSVVLTFANGTINTT